MTVVAGVDVGNTTTEVVLVEIGADAVVTPIGWDRAPTRGAKGSEASLHGAAVLLRRLEKRVQRSVDRVAAAPLRPVRTSTAGLSEAAPPTGRLAVVRVGGATPGGTGTAVGRPLRVDAATVLGEAVVLLVPASTGYAAAAGATRRWLDAGADVRGLLLADDEGVLVAARLPVPLPVADEVDLAAVEGAVLVAVEIRAPGHRVQDLGDPIRLSGLLGLDAGERPDAVAVADALGDAARGVVAVRTERAQGAPVGAGSLLLRDGGRRVDLVTGCSAELAGSPVGAVRGWRLPGASRDEDVDDLWLVELREIAGSVAARVGASTARALVVAGLHGGAARVDPSAALAAELGVPVDVVGSEAAAARAGALTTPGVRSSATVVDLGGGTVDAVGPDGDEVVAAGAGEMLTVAVATFLDVPRGAADWVKRGPSSRLEAPQVLLAEDGARTFLERAAASAAVGSLVVPGPAGLLPFGASLAPAEWRALRLRTKQRVLADNVVRALTTLGGAADDVLLVGGAAADEELVGLLRPHLAGGAVGRGDVAGRLGHRYAVAYGLALLATS